MAETKIKFGDILEISGKEKVIYCGKVESNVKEHHRLLFFNRKAYQVQYVQDSFFERLKQRGVTVKVIGSNKEIAEECRKKEKQKYDRIMF